MRRTTRWVVAAVMAVTAAGSSADATVVGSDTSRPSTPSIYAITSTGPGLVDLSWWASRDDVGVTEYVVLRNGVRVDTIAGSDHDPRRPVTISGLPDGTAWMQVVAVDAAGNESARSAPARQYVTSRPIQPAREFRVEAYDAATGCTTVSFFPTGDVRWQQVAEYRVLENLHEVARIELPGTNNRARVEFCSDRRGERFLQVEPVPTGTHLAYRTPPIRVFKSAYRAPRGFAVELVGSEAVLTWDDPSTEVEAHAFWVLDRGIPVASVDGAARSTTISLDAGTHWLQLVSVDRFATPARRTAPIRVDSTEAGPPPERSQPAPATLGVGYRHACGLLDDGTAACWGSTVFGASTPPSTQFVAIASGNDFSCGLRADGEVECWGRDFAGNLAPPAGPFTSITLGDVHGCGLRPTGTVDCWGYDNQGQTGAPAGTFLQVSAGHWSTCGLRIVGDLVCWGRSEDGQSTPPAGFFASLDMGYAFGCATRADEPETVCWGRGFQGQASPPSGALIGAEAGYINGCGLRDDATAVCWGSSIVTSPPAGEFVDVAGGVLYACGLRPDGTVECWGQNTEGQRNPPPVRFAVPD